MSTRALLDRIEPYCPGWQRSSGKKSLLKFIEQGVDQLFDFDHDSMIYRGSDNKGFPPYLKTVAGTYRYDITASNLSCGPITKTINGSSYFFVARKIKHVFIDVTRNRADYNRSFIGVPYAFSINPYNVRTDRIFISDVNGNGFPSMENTPAYFEFIEDPGTEDTRYFVEFYIGPARLLSENIQLPIPQQFEEALEDFVIGKVQKRESGRLTDLDQQWREYWVPEFQRYMSSNCTNEPHETETRVC